MHHRELSVSSYIFPAGVLFTHVGDCPVGVRKRWRPHTHHYPLLSQRLISAVGRQLKLVPAGGILPGKRWLPKGGFGPQQKINAAIQYHPANTEPTVHV